MKIQSTSYVELSVEMAPEVRYFCKIFVLWEADTDTPFKFERCEVHMESLISYISLPCILHLHLKGSTKA